MPNVFILGATGYLGQALAQSLLRSGDYHLFGSARDAAKGKTLTKAEITPIFGDFTDSATLAGLISSNEIDIVVDCSSAYEQAGNILQGVINASKARISALAKEKAIGPKVGFVYCSGSWVHGTPGSRVSDLSPVGTSLAKDKPAVAVGWRPAHEQSILAARDTLNVAILRPYAIYGRASWVWGTWWGPVLAAKKSGSTDTIQIPADRATRTGTIHVDDVAAGFHAAIDRIDGRLGEWPVFDLVGENLTVVEIMEAVAATLGVKAPLAYAGTMGNAFLEALSLVSTGDAQRARTVLGWEAKRKTFVLNLPTYVQAWEAAQEGK